MKTLATIFVPRKVGRPPKYFNHQVVQGEKWSRYEHVHVS